MSGQGGIGELSDLPRGCGSGSGGGGIKVEMELGPAQGECLMGTGEVEEPLSAHLSRKTAIMSQFESKALGLDKAILHSIDCCGKNNGNSEELCKYKNHIKIVLFHLQGSRKIEDGEEDRCLTVLRMSCFTSSHFF